MKQALISMLSMQHRMNTRIHPDWVEQDFAWYRAIWIECGELIDHYGYKWWKKQTPDMEQVRLEVIDIWHFGLSALFTPEADIDQIAEGILQDISDFKAPAVGVHEATEALAVHALQTQGFSAQRFWTLMLASGLDFEKLYVQYVGKNVLNFFRQDNGYQQGTYQKLWAGREDNEHLAELVSSLDTAAPDFAEQVYAALQARYQALHAQA